jgi:hypothetical protein
MCHIVAVPCSPPYRFSVSPVCRCAAGLTLSTRVFAQYPGGGGYPRGGGYPGSYGWFPLKPDNTIGNDPLNASPLFNLYDWTRLDIVSSGVTNGQPWGPFPVKYTSGQSQGSTGGVGPSSGNSSSRNISGTSTIKYQWVPPNNAAGQPDWVNFPAPPLFVLGSIIPTGSLTGPAGMIGSGSLTDGWGWSISMSMPCVVSELPHRKILPAVGSPAVFTFSPSATLNVSTPAGGVSQAGGGGVFLLELAYPITLTLPTPLTNPMLGDGSNPYVYDNTVPDSATAMGHLFVDGTVLALGASADDINWLLGPPSKIDCTFDGGLSGAPPNPATHSWAAASSSSLWVQTSQATDGRVQATAPYSDFVFFGLPAANSGFGNHTETLTVNGTASEVAHIQTFFLSKASNYPTAFTDNQNTSATPSLRYWTPNWYHYYNLAYTSPGKYQPGNQNYTDYTTPYAVHIEDQSYMTVSGLHVYALNPDDDFITYAGDLQLSGIWTYIFYAAHEKEHQTAFTDGTYARNLSDLTKPWITTPGDFDHLDNTWEDNHYFDSTSNNTTSSPPYRNETDAPDDEVIADIGGLGGLLGSLTAWQQDWAGAGTLANKSSCDGGLMYGTSHLAIPPGGTTPMPFFLFWPATQNPDNSWSYGQPVKVWSADNLKTLVPGLMTSLLKYPNRP